MDFPFIKPPDTKKKKKGSYKLTLAKAVMLPNMICYRFDVFVWNIEYISKSERLKLYDTVEVQYNFPPTIKGKNIYKYIFFTSLYFLNALKINK